RPALLLADGRIVDVDGSSPMAVTSLRSTNYFIALKHRNHLGVMTANGITFPEPGPVTFDFTTNSNLILGGTNGIRLLPNGNLALFTGDFNGDGQIQIAGDLNGMIPFLGQSGYLPADFDLNGQVQNTEIQLKLTPNLGRGAQFGY
ncbi:MAG: hypothetical protein AAGA62_03595, partial [Bacteroidota bacterium]